ncbi:MAG: ribose 5-phosphate isomerase B [Euryarchaeota archaeon]|nr:ribose 5-phosphate isomerase B [Euryarchaeota archaeon]|tara:strand:- start:18 stop:1976 length:1959 start_codon:yes stop_codon:yes gene_type:complete
MKFSIGCDHAGPDYKKAITEHLNKLGHTVVNRGTDTEDSVDYPDHAHAVAEDVESGDCDLGILICGSANGVSMTANKHQGIRAGLAWTPEIAELAKTHNNANIISIPARFVTQEVAIAIVDAFVNAEFEGGRHQRRVSKICCSLIAFFIALSPTIAQTDYASRIDSTGLYDHLKVFASDDFEGRETGTRGQRKAADYLIEYYKSLGFEPYDGENYTQMVPLINSQLSEGVITVDEEDYKLLDDFLLYPGIQVESLENKPMVFAGLGITEGDWDDYSNIDVKDKIVVVLDGDYRSDGKTNWGKNSNRKRVLAEKNGAAAFVVLTPQESYNQLKGRMKFYMQRKSTSINREKDGEGASIPTIIFPLESTNSWFKGVKRKRTAADFVKLITKKNTSYTTDLKTVWSHNVVKIKEEYEAANVLAYLPGTDSLLSEELVVITSHYDHIGIVDGKINNGADDDGSGTVTVLEIAEAYMQAANEGNGSRRSVLFMNVVGEEKGLLGSEWYSENPIFPLENTVANLNIDMIGRADEAHEGNDNYIYLIGSDKLSTELHTISEKANTDSVGLELDYTFNAPDDPNRFYYRSDHYNFAKHNIPVIFYFSGVHEDYHGPGDDYKKIMYNKTAKVGRLVYHTAWELLNRDKKIVVDVENDFPTR